MIGMSQIKKKLYTGIAIGLGVGIIGIGLVSWWAIATVKSYENGTNKKYLANYTQLVTVLNKDVIQGELITADMLQDVRVHKTTVPSGSLNQGSIVGQVAKYNISANVPITDNMIANEILSADVRVQELNTVLLPSDLVEGDYVDIRLMYPNGTDYIVASQKQVEKIAGQTMWVNLSEPERLLVDGAIVDSFLHQGSKLYATKYADAESQIKVVDDSNDALKGYLSEIVNSEKASLTSTDDQVVVNTLLDLIVKYKNFATSLTKTTENYQPNTQVIEMMKADKNIVQSAIDRLSADARTVIENANNTYKSEHEDDFSNIISSAQQSITEQQTQRTNLLTGEQSQ